MKSYGYVRVSGKGQVEGHGLERQEKAIQDYAEAHDIKVVKFFREEGVSGTLKGSTSLSSHVCGAWKQMAMASRQS